MEGFGYKAANLSILKRLVERAGSKQEKNEYSVKIPSFDVLTSREVQALLREHHFDLQQQWNNILQNLTVDPVVIFQSKVLPPEFIAQTASIAAHIRAIFKKQSEILERDSEAIPETLKDFFNSELFKLAKAQNIKLMVRSTGKEDTRKIANAGGNKSVANVNPNPSSLVLAAGEVVASYFEELSLTQRLLANDRSLLDSLPLTPALIQEMIGENTFEGAIPVGCVAYTREPAGKVRDIHIIQCSFGHNEGVVRSLVPLDTYYVSKSKQVRSVIKEKQLRLAPSSDGKLTMKANPRDLILKPTLSKQEVLSLDQTLSYIADFYEKKLEIPDGAMDYELVYVPTRKTFFLVQARPLPEEEGGVEHPSYLTQLAKFKPEKKIKSEIILPGSSRVLEITDKNQILTARTLEAAIQKYASSRTKNLNQMKVVFVEKEADATGHAANSFRMDKKIAGIVEDMRTLNKWLEEPNIFLLVDTQQGIILNLTANPELHSPSALTEYIKSGWTNYPLPLTLTSDPTLIEPTCPDTQYEATPCVIHRFSQKIDDFRSFLNARRADLNCSSEEIECLVKQATSKAIIKELEAINIQANSQENEILQSKGMQRLFAERFTEALLFQEEKKGIVASESFKTLQARYQSLNEFVIEVLVPGIQSNQWNSSLLKNQELLKIGFRAYKSAASRQLLQEWLVFVNTVRNKATELSEFVKQIDNWGIFDNWLNLVFPLEFKDWSQKGEEYLAHIESGFEKSKSSAEPLVKLEKALSAFDFSAWQDEGRFESNRRSLGEILHFFKASNLKSESEYERLLLIHTLDKLITTVDLAIKSLKSAPHYKERISKLKVIVGDYLSLLKSCLQAQENAVEWSHTSPLDQIAVVAEILEATDTSDMQGFSSQNFDVRSALIGLSTNYWDRPQTIEDVWTWTHQSLNVFTAALLKKFFGSRLKLPVGIQILSSHINGSLLALRFANNAVYVTINVAFGEHGARFLLHGKHDGSIDLYIDFYGGGYNPPDLNTYWKPTGLHSDTEKEGGNVHYFIANAEKMSSTHVRLLIDFLGSRRGYKYNQLLNEIDNYVGEDIKEDQKVQATERYWTRILNFFGSKNPSVSSSDRESGSVKISSSSSIKNSSSLLEQSSELVGLWSSRMETGALRSLVMQEFKKKNALDERTFELATVVIQRMGQCDELCDFFEAGDKNENFDDGRRVQFEYKKLSLLYIIDRPNPEKFVRIMHALPKFRETLTYGSDGVMGSVIYSPLIKRIVEGDATLFSKEQAALIDFMFSMEHIFFPTLTKEPTFTKHALAFLKKSIYANTNNAKVQSLTPFSVDLLKFCDEVPEAHELSLNIINEVLTNQDSYPRLEETDSYYSEYNRDDIHSNVARLLGSISKTDKNPEQFLPLIRNYHQKIDYANFSAWENFFLILVSKGLGIEEARKFLKKNKDACDYIDCELAKILK